MPWRTDDLLSTISGAMRSIIGWWLCIFATWLGGLWLGMCIGEARLYFPVEAVPMLIVFIFAWLVYPRIAIGFAVTLTAWYLPLKIDSTRLRSGAAVANFLTWLCIAASVFRGF